MPRVWLSLGSNIARESNLRSALRALREQFGRLRLSPVYESASVGFAGDAFYNLVVGIDCPLSLEELHRRLRDIEAAHGRTRAEKKFASRTLDIDILTWDQQVIDQGPVRLPRDEILKYAFVLGPLADVAPDERHPLDGRRYAELWAGFDRASQPMQRVDIDLLSG